ncbi:tetratricopeptide repeat protein [Candidatus Woesebacteria bacterium]|nr:tetratricopeptide repeat protein [Candidatus Woesebacteria bacterium]
MQLFLFKFRLAANLFVFLCHLIGAVALYPYRSLLLSVALLSWVVLFPLFFMPVSPFSLPQSPTLSQPAAETELTQSTRVLESAGFKKTTLYPEEISTRVRIWEQHLKLAPSHRDILLNLAFLYFSTGNYSQAEEFFAIAQSKDPNNPLFQLQLVEFF